MPRGRADEIRVGHHGRRLGIRTEGSRTHYCGLAYFSQRWLPAVSMLVGGRCARLHRMGVGLPGAAGYGETGGKKRGQFIRL